MAALSTPSTCQLAAQTLTPEDSSPDIDELVTLDEAERRYLRRVLVTTRLDRKQLAVKLGISERTLYRKLAEPKHRPGSRLGST